MKFEPSVLLHPNIPKPLHGLNPRTIMGQEWWDTERRKAYASTDFHCLACGVRKRDALIHQWLEAHEYYKFDYSKGLIEIERIIPLCHACHNYIHNGKLMRDVLKKQITQETFWVIVKHGTDVLNKAELPYNPFMISVLNSLYGKISFPEWALDLSSSYVYPDSNINIPWQDWRLLFNGKQYKPLHESYEEWARFYGIKGE